MARRWVAFLLGSVAVHGLLLADRREAPPAAAEPVDARRGLAGPVERARAAARVGRLRAERALVLANARDALKAGRLELGAFLLDAGRIDAELRGVPLDVQRAEALYDARVRALRALRGTTALPEAAAAVFADLTYHGTPGGLPMAALLDGGGSCEQVAQLLAAAAYDAGFRSHVTLRFYGAPMAEGAAHLTVVAPDRHQNPVDLLLGRRPYRGGLTLRPEDLLEVYARVHESPGAGPSSSNAPLPHSEPDRPTIARGLPPNGDRFPGALPLFAARAIPAPGSETAPLEPAEPLELTSGCAYFLRLGVLAPQGIPTETSAGHSVVLEPHRTPNRARLEREGALLSAAATALATPGLAPAEGLVARACIVALGETAAVDLTLAGERELARVATLRAREARALGTRELAQLEESAADAERLRRDLGRDLGGRGWLLLFLEGGDRVVFDLAAARPSEDWGRINAAGALLLWPATRLRALALVGTFPIAEQLDVMHEIFHAHDQLRPWSAGFDFGDDLLGASVEGAAFLRLYGVFRGLAWRLWEARLGFAEVLQSLDREAEAAHLGEPERAALLEYLGRNALGLSSGRSGAMALVHSLDRAAAARADPSLAPFRTRLAFLAKAGSVDATTLADAWRLP